MERCCNLKKDLGGHVLQSRILGVNNSCWYTDSQKDYVTKWLRQI